MYQLGVISFSNVIETSRQEEERRRVGLFDGQDEKDFSCFTMGISL